MDLSGSNGPFRSTIPRVRCLTPAGRKTGTPRLSGIKANRRQTRPKYANQRPIRLDVVFLPHDAAMQPRRFPDATRTSMQMAFAAARNFVFSGESWVSALRRDPFARFGIATALLIGKHQGNFVEEHHGTNEASRT